MELFGKIISWLGFVYMSALSLGAVYFWIQLALSAVQTAGYFLVVAILAGLPYFFLVLLNRFVLGAFVWLPWRVRSMDKVQST